MTSNDDDDPEAVHHDHILRSFRAYRYVHLAANNLRRQAFSSLSEAHQALLPNQLKIILDIDHRIVDNAEFLEDIAAFVKTTLHDNSNSIAEPSKPKPKVTEHEMEKLRSTLRHLHRDWSSEGRHERDKCFLPILKALDTHFANIPESRRRNVKVLVPGCGLGRLPFEIASRGYSCQGNEFSSFMLFTSNYILNQTQAVGEHTIYPFCHSLSNISTADAALRAIGIPDVLPSSLSADVDFSMAAGDFTEIYSNEIGEWDCIVTCFFIDTAHNIVKYLETIKSVLNQSGIWINLGPSLWHFEGMTCGSLDMPMDEVKEVARRMGFILANERQIELGYTSNPMSNMRYTYQADFWTATLA